MPDYYSQKLSAQRLRFCYEIAPPRVKRYLEAEIEFVLSSLKSSDLVLELGCGYGRVLQKLISKAKALIGIDTSYDSLQLALEMVANLPSGCLFRMNAVELGFRSAQFDKVICIQNGISAFHVDRRELIKEAIRVTKGGGTVFFSSYSERFWPDRLEWFEIQSKHGLIGEIDYRATGNGLIVCKDGFKAYTLDRDDFRSLSSDLGCVPNITEVDNSSVFCQISVIK